MASFRDRFWSPPVAKAVTSPGTILLAGAAAAVGVVLSPGIPAAIAIGALAGAGAFGARVLLAVPKKRSGPRIDPFGVDEPWRQFVMDAQSARRRFDEAIATMAKGPLRTQLEGVGERLDDGVQEMWQTAQRGHHLAGARRRLDVATMTRELQNAQATAAAAPGDPRHAQVVASWQAQVEAAQRMDGVISDAVTTLRLLDARLDEAVTRAIELTAGATSASSVGAGVVGGEVEGIVGEMEALRAALEDVGAVGGATGQPGTSGTAGPSPA